MAPYIVTSHPHEHRIVILGEPVDLVRSAPEEPPSARLTDVQAEHVRTWSSTLSVPAYAQDPIGRWYDPGTGEYHNLPDAAEATREIDHPYTLVEREEPGDDPPPARRAPAVEEVPQEAAPFVDPGAAPAEEV